MQKRGFFFTLDALIAMTIVGVGFFLVLTTFTILPDANQATAVLEGIEGYLSTTTINDVDDSYAGVDGTLWQRGQITQKHQTLLQQIGEFSYKNQQALATNFTQAVLGDLLPPQYHFTITSNNQFLFPMHNLSEGEERSYNRTPLLASKTNIQFGLTNTSQLWGPVTLQLSLWER